MLGVLLLGTEILFVSAVWSQSYETSPENCWELLKSWDSETIISLYRNERDLLLFNEEYESGDYNFDVTFDLGTRLESIDYDVVELEQDYNFDCFGVREVRISSTRGNGEAGRAEVLLGTELDILVVGVSSNPRQCIRDKCALHCAPGLMETAPLKYSPLTEEFWSTFDDSNIFHKAWIRSMDVNTTAGNIPSQWVSRLSIGNLKSLSLSGNNWTRPEKLLGCLPNLISLYLINNNIEFLPNDTFSCTPRLEELYLSGNRFLHLPFGIENLKHLRELHLENQKGRSIFQLSDNDLPSLKERYVFLTNMTVRIDLCNISQPVNLTAIEVFNSTILSGGKEEIYCSGSIQSIKVLKLHQVGLTVLPSNLMKQMMNIEELDVSGNHLTDCQGNVLGTRRKLNVLVMNKNRLRKLTADCFQRLEDLYELQLSENEIVSIEEGTFVGLVNLWYINLSRNKLVSIERGTFSGVIDLINLDLSFNELINIHYSVFLPVVMEEKFKPLTLEIADLSNNKLKEVILRTQSMITIDYLWLSNNSIRNIEVSNVGFLNLSYNSLDRIPDGLEKIPVGFRSVDFGGNNIACCHPNSVLLTEPRVNFTVTLYNLGTSEPLYCIENDQKIILQSVLLNTSLCVKQEDDSTSYVELWVSLGVFTVVTAVFMSFVFYYHTELAYLGRFTKILSRRIRMDEQKYDDAAYDAFVCYCGKNLAWIIRHLLGSIEGADKGYRLCIHDRDFTLGAAIDTNVLAALDKCRKVIFVLSPDFMSSKWCQWELEMATRKMFEEERHYIILIELESLEGVVLPKQMKLLMKSRPYLRWPGDSASEDDTAKFWEGLCKALGPSLFCKTGRRLPMISVLDIEE